MESRGLSATAGNPQRQRPSSLPASVPPCVCLILVFLPLSFASPGTGQKAAATKHLSVPPRIQSAGAPRPGLVDTGKFSGKVSQDLGKTTLLCKALGWTQRGRGGRGLCCPETRSAVRRATQVTQVAVAMAEHDGPCRVAQMTCHGRSEGKGSAPGWEESLWETWAWAERGSKAAARVGTRRNPRPEWEEAQGTGRQRP